jgi:primosomal protein N' (replication factor Y)
MSGGRYLNVALPVPLRRVFTYLPPREWSAEELPALGVRVLAPFSGRRLTGVVVGHPERPAAGVRPLPLLRVIDASPVIDAAMLDLCRSVARHYLAPPGEVLRAASPPLGGGAERSQRFVEWVGEAHGAAAVADDELFPCGSEKSSEALPGEVQRRVAALLRQRRRRMSVRALARALSVRQIEATLRRMEARGLVRLGEEQRRGSSVRRIRVLRLCAGGEVERLGPKGRELLDLLRAEGGEPLPTGRLTGAWGFSAATLNSLVRWKVAEFSQVQVERHTQLPVFSRSEPVVEPTAEQRRAIARVDASLTGGRGERILLHGVTGSGKTLVYVEAAARALELGQGVLLLVPEIALAPQLYSVLHARFPGKVAVLHSGLSAGERRDAWFAVHGGQCPIAVGARSAVFAPLSNLGLLIVDEEHESAYKGSGSFPYHARHVAEERAQLTGATLVLGSATPSVESFQRTRQGELLLEELPRRIDDRPLPEVRVIDMLGEFRSGCRGALSRELRHALQARLEVGEQAILLLNRRGYSPSVQCVGCGEIPECDDCSVRLTYHRQGERLRCHYCGAERPLPTVCPGCGADRRSFRGWGTQRVEEELARSFPGATVLRLDQDATRQKNAHFHILQRFADGDGEILLGTQMVAKGLHFPRVTLVGVINADTGLAIADFRAGERAFQLLTQVSGRAGRGDRPGEVLVQSRLPGNYAIRHARSHDYQGFFAEEIGYREELWYPPFSRLILLRIRGAAEAPVLLQAQRLAERLRQQDQPNLRVLGPAEMPVARVQGEHRQQILLKTGDLAMTRLLLLRTLRDLPSERGVTIGVDVDPQQMG